eukprot:TRINITY_DN23316_c0_g1_i1.p1 TRINITY_DN23316_c0_g1~~TRINITY_DN23316_c0_g1_i1.p1  ORF type:complete len:456 (+),score=36.22 TRINITY_DN23316_c0_g1_i1:49-1416(+)
MRSLVDDVFLFLLLSCTLSVLGVVCIWLLRRLRALPGVVKYTLMAQYCNVTSISIMLGALFDAYLLILGGSNEFVGAIESARGISALVFAFPLGWASDMYPKRSVLKSNLFLGLIAASFLLLGIPADSTVLIVVSCVACAIHGQCLFGLLPAFLAEMTEAGDQRTQTMSDLQTASSLGNASGPALQLLLIVVLGDTEWSVPELHVVLCLGFVFVLAYARLIWKAMTSCVSGLFGAESCEQAINSPSVSVAGQRCSLSPASSMPSWWRWAIAALCEATSLVTAIGSGMTFKYWPLFFKVDFKFSPAEVCAMQLGIWLAISASAQMAPALAKQMGRLPAALALHCSGTAALFLIAWQPMSAFIEIPLVLVRNALMNSGGPLVQALIMDLVPQEHRGKWSSIASLRRMTWSGSAFIGGMLSDEHDYRYAFFITACVHSVAGIVLLLANLLWWRQRQAC